MTKPTDQQLAANFMGAVTHLLGGRPGRHREFIDRVEFILSGSEPHAMQLMQFTARARGGRPTLWFHFPAEWEGIPQIGLVAEADGRTHILENCMLWLHKRNGRASLVPDNFQMGAFRFDDDLVLRRSPRAPARSFEAGQINMTRAYRRLREIEAEQLAQGRTFALPEQVRMKQAA